MWLILLLIAVLPDRAVVREHFDQLEVNIVWHETCETDPLPYRITFQQILFRNWHPETGEHEIEAWRMMRSSTKEEGEPARTLMFPQMVAGKYELRWIDGDVMRVVTADSLLVTNTTFDAEVLDRERWGKEKRRELRKAVR